MKINLQQRDKRTFFVIGIIIAIIIYIIASRFIGINWINIGNDKGHIVSIFLASMAIPAVIALVIRVIYGIKILIDWINEEEEK